MATGAKEGIRTTTLGSDDGSKEGSADRICPWPCKQEKCVVCEDQFLSLHDQRREYMFYTRRVPDSEASAIAERLASSAETSRALITQRLAQHGDLFMSRWKKRSKDKRVEILLRANADLPEKAGSFAELTQTNGGDYNWRHSRTPQFRLAALLPYITIATLKDNPAVLFALLHYRTRYTLEDWATFDTYQFRDPWKVGFFALELSPLRSAQGRRPRVSKSATSSRSPEPADGTTSQRHGHHSRRSKMDNHASLKWSALCHEGFILAGDVVQWSTYTNQPFSPPPLLNLDDVVSTAQLRFDALADHFALLQTDPTYLRWYVRTLMQGEAFKSGPFADVFGIVDSTIASDALSMWWWLCVREEAEHVRDVQCRFRDQIHRAAPLPPKYGRALAALELVLAKYMNVKAYMLRKDFQQRPGFARHSRFEAMPNNMLRVSPTDAGPLTNQYVDDFMYWCLMNLCGEPDNPAGFDHAQLFASLEGHLAKSSRAENARLDQILVDQLSGLAANHQLLLAVRLHRPLHGAGDAYDILETGNRRAWRKKQPGIKSFKEGFPARAALLGSFYQAAPPGGKKDVAWVERNQNVHQLMEAYWSSFRKAATDHMADEEVASYLRADLDPAHIAALEAKRAAILNDMILRESAPKQSGSTQTPLESGKVTMVPPSSKAKLKIRPHAFQNSDQGSEPPEKADTALPVGPQQAAAPAHPVAVVAPSKRAVEVFSKMFADDAESGSKGSDWDQFVHAMRDVGFTARYGAGSAVVFDLAGKGKIVIHRPHPGAKINAILLRAMGKCMAKWFGWRRESFSLDAA